MTRTQTIIWTALPHTVTKPDARGRQKLRLSIFVSPRLETTALMGSLGEFPDFESTTPGENWAKSMMGMSFQVQTATMFDTRVNYSATIRSAPEPALWDKFFGPQMPIKQFKFIDMSKVSAKTFSAGSVFDQVKKQYTIVAATPSLTYKVPTLAKMVQLPGQTSLPLINVLPTQVIQTSAISALALPRPGTTLTQASSFSAFEQFHKPFVKPPGFKAPVIPPMDFHKALSSLGNYPALLKRLGIIIEIEVPYSSAMASAKRLRIIPKWPDRRVRGTILTTPDGLGVVHKDASQWTAFNLSFSSTLPRTVTGVSIASRTDRHRNGYLVTRATTAGAKDPVSIYNMDVDLAAARMMATASNASSLIDSKVTATVGALSDAENHRVRTAALDAASQETLSLPAIGQPVLSMAVPGAATKIKQQLATAAAMNAKLVAGEEDQTINYTEELTRGYRVDVWDSMTRVWHPLCARTGSYSIGSDSIAWGAEKTLTDEGFVQLGVISSPGDVNTDAPPTDMRIHESIFDWTGWSLVVSRPGAALPEPDDYGATVPSKTFTGPDQSTHPIGHYLHPDLPLDVRFTVPSGTLPRLRFGLKYRFRARIVDLAGNSVAFSKGSTSSDPGGSGDTNPLVTAAVMHKRYEPVKPPTVVLTEGLKPSESPEVVVVRSYHDPATQTIVTQDASRHIAPPRTSVTMAEACAGLDASTAGKPLDPTLWSMLCDRDDFDFQKGPDGHQLPHPTIASPIAYLPEPFSHGAAFSGLPGVSATSSPFTTATGVRIDGARIALSSSASKTVTSTKISFDSANQPWYDKRAFKLAIHGIEATDSRLKLTATPRTPQWSGDSRVLGVDLPKGDQVTVALSSYMTQGELGKMGVYEWGLTQLVPSLLFIPGITAAAAATNVPTTVQSTLPTAANSMIALSNVGQNWMLSPSQDLTLVHAVDLPMIDPVFTTRAHFERHVGDTHATLVDWMQIHGKSTSKVEVSGNWTENVDDPSAGAPKWKETAVKKSAAAFSLPVEKDDKLTLNAKQPIAVYSQNYSWGTQPIPPVIDRPGVDYKQQRQFFGDTKHKKIELTAKFTSRFDKYFSDIPGLTFTSASAPKTLHVPSSARPAAPVLSYIIPTFGWSRTDTSSTRQGGGLRVYLERPWFSSGDEERLAVVMYQPMAYDAGWAQMQPFVTQWGNDPLSMSSSNKLPASRPSLASFGQRAASSMNLRLRDNMSSPVMVAAYDVDYDSEADLWFADIVIDQGKAYFPFVKLALARYQKYALPNCELSPITLADFVQLTPDRSASATMSPDGTSISVSVTGYTFSATDSGKLPTVMASIEKKLATDTDAAWKPLTGEMELARRPRSIIQIATGDTHTTWAGSVRLAEHSAGVQYRVVLREYEWYKRYQSTELGKRMVFAEAFTLTT